MANPYGHFDDERREYVVTRPDTPLPWLNYLGQDDLFGLCTNTGGGYTFWRDAKLRRLTRYRYNNVPLDTGGRYLYVHDDGSVWNPGWKPVKAALDAIRVPGGPRLHAHHRCEGWARGGAADVHPAERGRRALEGDRPQHVRASTSGRASTPSSSSPSTRHSST